MEVIHYLSAQVSKRVFYHESYGIACCADAIRNYDDFDLQPIITAGVCHADVPLSARRFYTATEPFSLTALLADFWSINIQAPFHGMGDICGSPDKLVIDKRLEGGLQPSFFQWLNKAGVSFEFSESRNKKFNAKTRFLQDRPWYFGHRNFEEFKSTETSDEPYPLTFEIINREFSPKYHHLGIEDCPPAKRDILSKQYPIEHGRTPFSALPGNNDFFPELDDLKMPQNSAYVAHTATWHHSDPKREDFGFISINDEQGDEGEDDYFNIDNDEDELDDEDVQKTASLTKDWRDLYNEQDTLLDQVMHDPISGRPLNRWIVTFDDKPDGWWGEGYVIHTSNPAFVCSWGRATLLEGEAMGASIKIGEDRCIAVCFSHSLAGINLYAEENFHNLMHQAVAVVCEYLIQD
ncbi:hypothetical protein [Vibrio parahaemolyticus]|uniref:hypothetical protein n=1 Tax=Vibrio parahaemolyticus TaxID=670 RepID=UPI000812D425|nr:hypothetical protein [Vibrio parahaemolyticus]OCP65027.1 hypothetical protein AKH08_24250 [Vibrio parahaemolyticus]